MSAPRLHAGAVADAAGVAPKRVSMLDVAALAGVSGQTVSRVVNGSPRVDPATRARVEEAMARLGYRPHRAARALKGRHDFHSFETHWPNRTSSVRTITHLAVNRMGRYVWVDVEADGFLYNMVRSIAGTLLLVGSGRWPEGRVAEALAAEDRREAGPTAPPGRPSGSARGPPDRARLPTPAPGRG